MSVQQNSEFSAEQYATILNFLEDSQNCATHAALVAVEEKRLKFEQMKWETEREDMEVRRREDKEDERVRRAEEKAEKCRERRFALLQTMIADGKSTNEIKELLSMLL